MAYGVWALCNFKPTCMQNIGHACFIIMENEEQRIKEMKSIAYKEKYLSETKKHEKGNGW